MLQQQAHSIASYYPCHDLVLDDVSDDAIDRRAGETLLRDSQTAS